LPYLLLKGNTASGMFQHVEPYHGWLMYYENASDERSPFHDVEHSLFHYDRQIYTFAAHPLWDTIQSESLLTKILYADYERGTAVVELLGEWNDLFENDFRMLRQQLSDPLYQEGIQKFIFICENVFNAYVEGNDYYQELAEFLEEEEGYLVLLRCRDNVKEDLKAYGIDEFFFWSPQLDSLNWRKLKPWFLLDAVDEQMTKVLTGGSGH